MKVTPGVSTRYGQSLAASAAPEKLPFGLSAPQLRTLDVSCLVVLFRSSAKLEIYMLFYYYYYYYFFDKLSEFLRLTPFGTGNDITSLDDSAC